MRSVFLAVALISLVAFAPAPRADDFYKGKTITFILGSSPGGGFDVYTRAIARHLGKHIPGNPRIIVNYIEGAGGLIAANRLYHDPSMQDGLTVGLFAGSLVLYQKLGEKGADFDAGQFNWMGTPVRDSIVCALTKNSGIASVQEWYNAHKPVKLGAAGPGTTLSEPARILKASTNLPIQVVEGYKGANDVKLAAEQGEVDGACWNWGSIKVMWKTALEANDVKIVVQINPRRDPELPNVPNALELVKTDVARQLLTVGVNDQTVLFRAYSIPPRVPADRVKILQQAFMSTMSDPAFLKDAKQTQIEIAPVSGEDIKQVVNHMNTIDPLILAKLKKILFE
jgi:tripartite-type tricarboxylate transporter receptor subunit TctC